MAGMDMSRLALAMLGLSLLVLVVGQQADNSHFLTFNDPVITTQQATVLPVPINTPPITASPQEPAAPLPINTPPAIPSPIPIGIPIELPSPIPIDTPIAFPAPSPIDLPIPTPPIPGIDLPKHRHCAFMCFRLCSVLKNRLFFIKCLGICNQKICIGGISDVVLNCTKTCAESKSPDFIPDAANVLNHVSSCYEDCKKN